MLDTSLQDMKVCYRMAQTAEKHFEKTDMVYCVYLLDPVVYLYAKNAKITIFLGLAVRSLSSSWQHVDFQSTPILCTCMCQ